MIAGLLPALHTMRADAQESLREGARALLHRFENKRPEQVATMQTVLPASKYETSEKRIEFARRLDLEVEGRVEPPLAERPQASSMIVSPEYFSLMKLVLKSGRVLQESDTAGREAVCVIDELIAPAVYAQRNYCKVVGIVGAAGKRSATKVDAEQPVEGARAYQQLIENTLAGFQIVANRMSCIGGVALILACLRIYSVMSYTASERTSEIGMRMAMGAQTREVLMLVGKQASTLCGAGLVGAVKRVAIVGVCGGGVDVHCGAAGDLDGPGQRLKA